MNGRNWMRRSLALSSLFVALGAAMLVAISTGGAAAAGTRDETKIDWSKEPVEGARVVPGTAPGGGPALRVDASPSGLAVRLATIDRPSVEREGYVVTGQVRYQGVQGRGYLEMWSVFADGSRYFSRTLAEKGPLAALSGTSGWRSFGLPFYLDGAGPPSSLEINLVLPGAGTVWLGPMGLRDLDAAPRSPRGWWTDRTAGVFGGVLGSLIGVLGATIGSLAARGRARRFAIGSLWTVAALGAVLLVVAVAALVSSQPWVVWYSAALTGGLCLVLGLATMGVVRRRYAEAELRKMKAADARRTLASQGR
jgi:hypothetical protein